MTSNVSDVAEEADELDRRLILAARTVLMVHRELERAARDADMTIPQYRFLLYLKRRGPMRAGDLALDSAIGRSTASALIGEMERRGLIARQPDAEDGRSVLLRLTPEGIAKHATFERELARVLAGLLPSEESDEILKGLTHLAYHIDRRRRD
ncbi:MAG: transcriptional regulator, MarR family [Caulobacter sp.]|nr:transcriptional regulator, MarR family [Caulobacter sp.]